MAVTIGFLRPAVLLPKEARMWPPERLRAVLLHEMAHVGRADWAAQMLTQVAGALYWPNPLVWLALRRLRAESEQACDDLVLGAGVRASDYAGHLLEIVRGLCDRRGSAGAALTVVRRQEIQERLGAILAEGRSRRPGSRRMFALALLAAAGVLVPLAALRPEGVRALGPAEPAWVGKHEACMRNLKRLSIALLMYAQDYDAKLPPMRTMAQVQNRVRPYVRNDNAVFVCPETGQPYQPNVATSHQRVLLKYRTVLPGVARTPLLWDARPHATSAPLRRWWNVLYADGSVRRETLLPKGASWDPRRAEEVRREIDAAYARLARAIRSKDVKAVFDLKAPDFVVRSLNSGARSRAQVEQDLRRAVGQTGHTRELTFTIESLIPRDDEVFALVRQRISQVIVQEGGRRVNSTGSLVTQDTWVKTPQGWRQKEQVAMAGSMTIGGRPYFLKDGGFVPVRDASAR